MQQIEAPPNCNINKRTYTRSLRMTTETLDQMIVRENDDSVWSNVTHIHFTGLAYRFNNKVCIGYPYLTGDSVFELYQKDPNTYIPWIKRQKEKYPHLKFVWVMPPADNIEWAPVVKSINNLLEGTGKDIIDGIEINGHYGCLDKMFAEIYQLETEIWLNLPHTIFFNQKGTNFYNYVQSLESISYFIIESFGYTRPWFEEGQPDSSVSDWVLDFGFYSSIIPAEKIVIGIATTAIIHHPDLGMAVLPLYEVVDHARTHTLIRNISTGFSILKNGESYISYDDEVIRHLKIAMVTGYGLAGMIMGEISDDIKIEYQWPLFRQMSCYFQHST